MKTHYITLTILIVFSLTAAFAQTPRTLSYQSVLTDATGNPKPDGQYNIVFRLYLNEIGGIAQWTESKFITASKGLFSTLLGDSVSFPSALKWDAPYWISIQVDAGNELSPRINLATTAYSFRAIIADNAVTVDDGAITASKLAPNSVTSPAIQDGSVQMSDIAQAGATTGQALVWNGSQWSPATVSSGGSFTAGAGINIAGNVISNTGDLSNTNEIQTLSLAGNQLSLSNGGGSVTLPGGGGTNYWTANGSNISNNNSGFVGIGTATPTWKLDLQADGAAFRIDGTHPWMELWDGGVRGGYFRNLNGNVEIGTVNTNTEGSLAFWAGGTEKMRLSKDGWLGIGTSSPQWKLDLQADGGAFRIDGNHPWMELWDGGVRGGYFRNLNGNIEIGTVNTNTLGTLAFWSGGQESMRISSSGLVGIGTSTPDALLDVQGPALLRELWIPSESGKRWAFGYTPYSEKLLVQYDQQAVATINTNGAWAQWSDRRLKKDIVQYHSVLAGVLRLNVCTYRFKTQSADTTRSLGLIAQDVREEFPELVSTMKEKNGEEFYGVTYAQTGVIALKAIQEQQSQIEKQQSQIEEQQSQIQDLKSEIAELKRFLQTAATR